ncbi:MAG: hypothetical protein GF317_18965 [Candidatus Lokiarchaeota archaeon]|nr:hypothetical protein [Candidatus Lokiarchaeota archaeon]MBD3201597.1 hypothetical protein [Candidatus Lokiarchaeota archaeon]
MSEKKSKYWTVGQIDATGVRGPHEKELEDISKAKNSLFIDIEKDKLNNIVKNDVGGIIENTGFSEDWTITKEMFPEVKIHLAFTYFGDEFGDGIEAEFQFLFSGNRVEWVPGEDSATYIDVIMDFMERQIKGKEPFEKNYNEKTELMKKVLKQRKGPFKLLKEEDQKPLEDFIGGKVWKTTTGWRFKKEIFPQIFIELLYNNNNNKLDISYSGDNLEKIGSYHIELIGIFNINHILRYITMENQDKDLPDICYMMFSRIITKEKGWKHRTI